MLKRSRFLLLALMPGLLLPGVGLAGASGLPGWRAEVLRLEVTRSDGRKELGSGVLIAPQRLLTNCHVVRSARAIMASRGDESWMAHADTGDSYLDLCRLRLDGHPGTPPPLADPDGLQVGQNVFAAGYSGGTFSVSQGRIKGLFTCPCGGGRVIQTSAGFDPGASGGGLFNTEGELIGILTFKSRRGGDFHFALPVGWMKELNALPDAELPDRGPFWKNPSRNSAYFLAACDLGAKKKWLELARLAPEWVREEPGNPEAWMASGRANLGLKRLHDAARDFQQALRLDSTHGEALLELQQLELELGESLLEN